MGRRYLALCSDCDHKFSLNKGGGWTWYQKICNQCGLELRVPRNGPEIFEENKTLTREELSIHLQSPQNWSRRGGKFDEKELKILAEMISECKCGGEFIPEWDQKIVYRCPICKSKNLALDDEILFD